MLRKNLPTSEGLHKLLICDFATGQLYWRPRSSERWNARYAGKRAMLSDNGNGYMRGVINYIPVYAHRVVWCMYHGCWPDMHIDHIDRNPKNNSIANLRLATRSQNLSNVAKVEGCSSSYKGVSWRPKTKNWVAYITTGQKRMHLGYFKSEEGAARAYNKAAENAWGQFAVLNEIAS